MQFSEYQIVNSQVVLAEVKKKLGHKDYIKPLLEISLTQL